MHCITGLRTARLIHLSRRSLLTGLGIGTVALLAATTPASWAASGVTAGLTPDPETIDVATTDGTTVAVPVLLGGILTVSGGGLPAGTRIAVTWASALYAVEAAPALTRGTDAFACSFDAPPSDDGTTAGATVVLEADMPDGDYTLALGSVRALTYPDDVIDPPAATSLTLALPDGAAPWWANYKSDVEDEVRKIAGRSDVVVSPDGRYASVIVRAYVSLTPGEHVSAVAVLDRASGRAVRTEEIRGLVLGQALTDDALVIQTSSLLHPGSETVIAGPDGPGAGDVVDTTSTLTAFPLADPQAPPATGSTPLWLLGATHDSLILGAARIDPECLEGNCLGYRASLATATGQTTGQIDGVYAVHPNGLLERFTGGEADDGVLSNTVRHAADQDGSHRGQTWIGLSRELLDPVSGAAADITGLTLSDVPTATTWITARWRPAWSEGEKGKALFKPEADGWMAAPGDPVSTEPAMTLDRDDNPSKGSPVITVSLTRTAFTGRTA